MARPTTRAALIAQILVERRRLEKNLDRIDDADMIQPACSAIRESYQTTLETIQAMTDVELFTKGHYAWTQGELLAGYVSANTGSHYRWAKTGIRKWLRAKGKG